MGGGSARRRCFLTTHPHSVNSGAARKQILPAKILKQTIMMLGLCILLAATGGARDLAAFRIFDSSRLLPRLF